MFLCVCVCTNVCVCVRVGMSCVLHVKVPFLKDVSTVLHVKISLDMYDISFLNDVCSVFDIIVNQSRIILNNVCSKMHTFD